MLCHCALHPPGDTLDLDLGGFVVAELANPRLSVGFTRRAALGERYYGRVGGAS